MGKVIIDGNDLIAEFMGLHYHPRVHLQDYGTFHNEPSPESREAGAWSVHKKLKYKKCDAPAHWNLPDVVDENETPVIENLEYHSSWERLMPVIEKINGLEGGAFKISLSPNWSGANIGDGGLTFNDKHDAPIIQAHKAVVAFLREFL